MTWVYGIAQGVLAFCGVVLLLMALQYISPTQNKVIRSFQVVGSYILQVSVIITFDNMGKECFLWDTRRTIRFILWLLLLKCYNQLFLELIKTNFLIYFYL